MVAKTVSTKIVVATAGLILAASAGASQAATVTYDFTGATTAYSSTKTFNSTPGGGPTLTVSANTVNDLGTIITPVTGADIGVGQWTGLGLGLKNSSTDNSHTVDGYGLNDLLVLTFLSSVKIVSATFNYAGQVTNSNDGFAFFADLDNNGSVAGNMIFSSEDIVGAPYSGSYNFITGTYPGNYISKVFGIGAIYDALIQSSCSYHYNCTSYTVFDSFKLASVTVATPPQVPLPAGAILLFSGLAGLGIFGRFKSKATQAAV
jgi:hypothetical protein